MSAEGKVNPTTSDQSEENIEGKSFSLDSVPARIFKLQLCCQSMLHLLSQHQGKGWVTVMITICVMETSAYSTHQGRRSWRVS